MSYYNNNNNQRSPKKKKSLLINVSIPTDDNVEKIPKYKHLEIEVTRMWSLKAETIPIIIGALGMIKKHSDRYITKTSVLTNVHNIQEIVLLGTEHILRKALSIQ
uniref:Uncharacterized protein n=1 Tax=Octopus bimaculoides TaxID=37653 RepID=A0A0L8I1Q0_OCTBM